MIIQEKIKETKLVCDVCSKIIPVEIFSQNYDGKLNIIKPIDWLEYNNRDYCSEKCLNKGMAIYVKELKRKIINDKNEEIRNLKNLKSKKIKIEIKTHFSSGSSGGSMSTSGKYQYDDIDRLPKRGYVNPYKDWTLEKRTEEVVKKLDDYEEIKGKGAYQPEARIKFEQSIHQIAFSEGKELPENYNENYEKIMNENEEKARNFYKQLPSETINRLRECFVLDYYLSFLPPI